MNGVERNLIKIDVVNCERKLDEVTQNYCQTHGGDSLWKIDLQEMVYPLNSSLPTTKINSYTSLEELDEGEHFVDFKDNCSRLIIKEIS